MPVIKHAKNKLCEVGNHQVERLWRAKGKSQKSACRSCADRERCLQSQKSQKVVARQLSVTQKQNDIADELRKKELTKWFDVQLSMVPANCENCGIALRTIINPRETICHILPKAGFHSVETHPLNRWFGCLYCHLSYDNTNSAYQEKMPVIEIVKQRFLKFKHLITDRELIKLPKFLHDLL